MATSINFDALKAALLARSETLVPAWLPGGTRRGHEWVCGSLDGGAGTSCSVNLISAKWSDFSTGESGGDLIDLYAQIHGLRNELGKAAAQVAREEGLEDLAGTTKQPGARSAPRVLADRPAVDQKPRTDEGWRTTVPVPAMAPAPTFRHQYRKPEDILHTATYQVGDDVFGYVVRFATSDGGKETLPYTWCTSARDGASRWHWKQWDEPRPLFIPSRQWPGARTVVLVEGEIKAEVLQQLLDRAAPGVYVVVSWPGGCKAWKKADWTWLKGATVLLWPDCDSKREPLTKAEKVACGDSDAALILAQQAKPFQDAAKQPGMAAMLGIGALLRSAHGCSVQMLPIEAPGVVKDGWDCADAIREDGWDAERTLAFFARAFALPADVDAPVTPDKPAGSADVRKKIDRLAEAEDSDDAFAEYLEFVTGQAKCQVWELGITRKLLITALRKAPALSGCLGFNELTGAPSTKTPWPWRSVAGPLKDSDDLRLGDWLSKEYGLKAASRAALAEAIDTVADERRYHPIRDWLGGLQHDGKPRLDKWFIHVLGMDPAELKPKRRKYLEMVGRFVLLGLVARVMKPGCKFDYSPVFEGLTGVGKSTFVKVLVGAEFFSDTHFDIGNGKDGFEQLEGLWGYELSELTALRKADSEQVKGFFSSTIDRFRGAYGRFVQAHPRQCVIFCSTNKTVYLYDLTGNRRFWPVWISKPINLEWLAKYRDQLFAEAYAAYNAGAVIAPTREEEKLYFEPEQRLRLVESAVQSRLYELLTRVGAPAMEGETSNKLNQLTTFVTLDRLVQALGADAAKSSSLLESQIRGWLEANGWVYGRESTGQRRRGYRQPPKWPPEIDEEGDEPPEETGAPAEAPAEESRETPAGKFVKEEDDDAPF